MKLIRPSSSSGLMSCFRVASRSESEVHAWPDAGTNCRGSSQTVPVFLARRPGEQAQQQRTAVPRRGVLRAARHAYRQ